MTHAEFTAIAESIADRMNSPDQVHLFTVFNRDGDVWLTTANSASLTKLISVLTKIDPTDIEQFLNRSIN